ncbi:MAG: hypothetical protein KA731_01805 [Candidatus Moranbacteria bacterium]|nr:hypothetical protein [Candidatus Moranbacteria bacterium]
MQGVSREVIEQALRGGVENPEQLLTIIANQNLDLTQVAEFWAGYFGPSWEETIKQKLGEGFVTFRIQTEFGINGHSTMIYMAKMKTN